MVSTTNTNINRWVCPKMRHTGYTAVCRFFFGNFHAGIDDDIPLSHRVVGGPGTIRFSVTIYPMEFASEDAVLSLFYSTSVHHRG